MVVAVVEIDNSCLKLNLCLLAYFTEQLKLSEGELGERVLRSEHRPPAIALPLASTTRKRKPLTPEELEERRRKV